MNNSLTYYLIGIVVTMSMVLAYTSDNTMLSCFAGITLVIGLIVSIFLIQRSMEWSHKQKRMAWLILLPMLSLIGFFLASCANESAQEGGSRIYIQPELSKKEFYLNQMKVKNFQLEVNGPCDDALDDTLHERAKAYFDSKTMTDTSVVVEFKFIEACCQKFLGDYEIANDTLKFTFEQVNDEVCSCLCWYRYRLTIHESGRNIQYISIDKK